MENRRKLVRALATLLMLCFPFMAHPLEISLSPYIEPMIGDAREYVYENDRILSELIWDMRPMVSIGLAGDICWMGGFKLSAEASAGIPGNTGSMQDSDWLNLDLNSRGEKTTYSKHDADLQFAYQGKIEAGWDFLLPITGPASTIRVSIVPTLGFRFMNWKWNGNDGYIQHLDEVGYPSLPGGVYRDWNKNVEKKPATGTVISYQQQFWMPTAALEVSVPVASRFHVGLGCAGTLWASCYALDMHFDPTTGWDFSTSTEKKQFFDILASGWMIEPRIEFAWECAKNISLYVTGAWTKISGLRGDTRFLANGASFYTTFSQASGSGGGAALDTLRIRCGASFQLNGLILHKP